MADCVSGSRAGRLRPPHIDEETDSWTGKLEAWILDSMSPSPRILVLDRPITARELEGLLGNPFDDMVKFVVDLDRRLVAFGGELHADAEAVLLDMESRQESLWGGNYHPQRNDAACIEYTSLINIRPAQGNRSIEIQDGALRGRIRALVLERVGRAGAQQP